MTPPRETAGGGVAEPSAFAASFLAQPHCKWRSIGIRIKSGGLSKRKRHWICLACGKQARAPKHPPCPLSAVRSEGLSYPG